MKPKISKRDGRWWVERPGYGFTPGSVDGYPSWRDAVGSLRSAPASAAAVVSFGSFTLGLTGRHGLAFQRGTIRMEDQ